MTDLIELVQHLGAPRVLVVGDVMLDRYVWGERRAHQPGSARHPAARRHARGAARRREQRRHHAASARRTHERRRRRRHRRATASARGSILTDLGIDAEGVVADPDRPTTVKERYIGRAQAKHPQQMIRVDYESREPASEAVERQLADALVAKIRDDRHRSRQRLRQGRLHAGAACDVVDHGREAARHSRDRRPDPRRRLPQVPRLFRDDAEPPRSGPGDRTAPFTRTTDALAAAARTPRPPRPRSRHRHARQGRHGAGPPRRPQRRSSRRGRARCTTSPGPATW